MIIPSNLHTHTTYCDGKSTAREMAEAALERGFTSLGFSGHSYVKGDEDWVMTDEAGYREHIRALAKEYEGRIEILCGIEWDADSEIERDKYDYAIASVHAVKTEAGRWAVDNTPQILAECIRDGFGGDAYAMCRAYFELVVQSALRPGADVVGHFDVVAKYNARGEFFDESDPRYLRAAKDALEAICNARPDIIFECNVGGMARAGRAEPYPPLWALKYLKERGMRVTVTSDAHDAALLDTGFEHAVHLLREVGCLSVTILKNGKFEEYKI